MYNIIKRDLIHSLRYYNRQSNIDKVKISAEETTTDDLTIFDTLASSDNIEEEVMEKYKYKEVYNMIDQYYSKNELKRRVMYYLLSDYNITKRKAGEKFGITRSYANKIYWDFIEYGRTQKSKFIN